MTSPSRSPREHYRDAERLLAAAETSRTEQMQSVDALIAIGHALLAAAPRRARRQPHQPGQHIGESPTERWLRGDDLGSDR